MAKTYRKNSDGFLEEVIPQPDLVQVHNLTSLQKEKADLQARIAEIDVLLSERTKVGATK